MASRGADGDLPSIGIRDCAISRGSAAHLLQAVLKEAFMPRRLCCGKLLHFWFDDLKTTLFLVEACQETFERLVCQELYDLDSLSSRKLLEFVQREPGLFQ